MEKINFEAMLDKCCKKLTAEARQRKFVSSTVFENRVREVLHEQTKEIDGFKIDFNPRPQAFPDIAL